MLNVSLVTWNRVRVLEKTLRALERNTKEPYRVLVSDNGSGDGTQLFLESYADEHPGLVDLYFMPENSGIAVARNAHWAECVGQDAVRLDDKVCIESPYWSQIMRRQAYQHHSLIAFTDPDTEGLWTHAKETEVAEFAAWTCGASLFIPAEVSEKLGGWSEDYGLYGHEDLDYMDRAASIGWPFRYTLAAHATFLARANPATRAGTEPFVATYQKAKAEYLAGERDIFIPLAAEKTLARTALIREGHAMELAWP